MELQHTHLTHMGIDEYMKHTAGRLAEMNIATEFGGSAVTSRGTLGTSFLQEEFPPPHGCQPMEIVHALILLNMLNIKQRSST